MDRPQSAPTKRVIVPQEGLKVKETGHQHQQVRLPRPPSASSSSRNKMYPILKEEIISGGYTNNSDVGGSIAPSSVVQFEHVLRPTVAASVKSEAVHATPRASTSTGYRTKGRAMRPLSATVQASVNATRTPSPRSLTTSRPTSAQKVLIVNAAARPSSNVERQIASVSRAYPVSQILPMATTTNDNEISSLRPTSASRASKGEGGRPISAVAATDGDDDDGYDQAGIPRDDSETPIPPLKEGAVANEKSQKDKFFVPGVSGFSREKQEGLFRDVAEMMRLEHTAYNSFVNCCDSALTHLAVTMEGIPSPNSVTAGVGAMILTKLSHLVGPSFGDFMRRMLDTVFAATFKEYSSGDVFKDPTGEFFYKHTILVEANQALTKEATSLKEQLDRVSETNARQGQMIEGVLNRFDMKHLAQNFQVWRKHVRESRAQHRRLEEIENLANSRFKKQNVFLRWQRFTQWSRDQRTSALSSKTHEQLQERVKELQQRCTAREEEILKQRSAKERNQSRATHLEEMMNNIKEENSRLTGKLQETEGLASQLTGLCGDVLGKLDEATNFLGVSAVPASIQKLTNIGLTGSSLTFAAPAAMGDTSGSGGVGTISTSHGAARRVSLSGANRSTNPSSSSLPAAGGGGGGAEGLLLPLPHTRLDGAAWRTTVLHNAKDVLLAWCNHVLSDARTELMQFFAVSGVPPPGGQSSNTSSSKGNKRGGIGSSSSGVGGVVSFSPDLGSGAGGGRSNSPTVGSNIHIDLPVAIINLKSDLSDGVFFLLVLSMLLGGGVGAPGGSSVADLLSAGTALSSLSGGGAGVEGSGSESATPARSPFVFAGAFTCLSLLHTIDSDAERMAQVVRMATYIGLDGGVKAEDLLSIGSLDSNSAESEPLVLGFLSRLFVAYTETLVLSPAAQTENQLEGGALGRAPTPGSNSGVLGGLGARGNSMFSIGARVQLPVELTQGVGGTDPRFLARGACHFYSKRFYQTSELMRRNQDWRAIASASAAFFERNIAKRLRGEVEDATLVEFSSVDKTLLLKEHIVPLECLRFTKEVSPALKQLKDTNNSKSNNNITTPPNTVTTPSSEPLGGTGLKTPPPQESTMSSSSKISTPPQEQVLEELKVEQDDAAQFMAEEMSSCLLSWARRLREAALHYASCCGAIDDHNPRSLDLNSWQKFMSESKLVPRYANTKAADAVFKQHSLTPVAAYNLLKDHIQQQVAAAGSSTTTTSKDGNEGGAGAPIAAFPKTKSSDTPFLDVHADWCHTLVRIFFTKTGSSPQIKTLTSSDGTVSTVSYWPNADETVSLFKKFIEGAVIPHCPLFQAESLTSNFNLLAVQDVLKQFKDAIKKLFGEFAKDKSSSADPRMRIEGFQLLVVKELKLLETNDAQYLFAVIRQCQRNSPGGSTIGGASASPGGNTDPLATTMDVSGQMSLAATIRSMGASHSMHSPLTQLGSTLSGTSGGGGGGPSVAFPSGIALPGFCMALVALSRLRFGNMMVSQSQALQMFLTLFLFPVYQHRLKLKF